MFSTTEITSHEIGSDNVIHQRLFYAYVEAAKMIDGNVLELGCGAGRGMKVIADACAQYTGIDKNKQLLDRLQQAYPNFKFLHQSMPPLSGIADNTFDYVITFQVIEHIEDDNAFLQEIQRVLKPGGTAVITTPNLKKSLTRNPWHIREYQHSELQQLLEKHFSSVEVKGISGTKPVMDYYEENKASVRKITRFDVLNLQHRLPRRVLQIPYEFLNRRNRKKLMNQTQGIVNNVTVEDYFFCENPAEGFDFFCIAKK